MKKNFKLCILVLFIFGLFFSYAFDVEAKTKVEDKKCYLNNKKYYHNIVAETSSKTNPETYRINFYTCDDVYTINFRIIKPQGKNKTEDKVNAVINISKSELKPGKYYSTSDSEWSIMLSKKFISETLNKDEANNNMYVKCDKYYEKCAAAYDEKDYTDSFNPDDVKYFKKFNIYSSGKNNHDSGIKGEVESDPEINLIEPKPETGQDTIGEFYFCNADSVKAFRFIGYIISTIKIIAPICIILFASIDYFRAIMSNDEKAISVSTKSFIRRLIAGIVIFLVPTIVSVILDIISPSIGDIEFSEYITCTKCIFNPSDCNPEGLPKLNKND